MAEMPLCLLVVCCDLTFAYVAPTTTTTTRRRFFALVFNNYRQERRVLGRNNVKTKHGRTQMVTLVWTHLQFCGFGKVSPMAVFPGGGGEVGWVFPMITGWDVGMETDAVRSTGCARRGRWR